MRKARGEQETAVRKAKCPRKKEKARDKQEETAVRKARDKQDTAVANRAESLPKVV